MAVRPAHEGRLPAAQSKPAIAAEFWEMPGPASMRYLYVPSLKIGEPAQVLAYEPAVYGDERFVLSTNGEIVLVATAELHKRLWLEQRP